MAESKVSSYNGDAEDLHKKSKDLNKQSVDGFVNPGTPASALVGMNDRKTGVIAGNASEVLKSRLAPQNADGSSVGPVSDNGGVLPVGKSS